MCRVAQRNGYRGAETARVLTCRREIYALCFVTSWIGGTQKVSFPADRDRSTGPPYS